MNNHDDYFGSLDEYLRDSGREHEGWPYDPYAEQESNREPPYKCYPCRSYRHSECENNMCYCRTCKPTRMEGKVRLVRDK